MSLQQTIKVSGNSRPTVADFAAAVELLRKYGVPDDKVITAITSHGGPWSAEVTWDPSAIAATIDGGEDLRPDPEESRPPWPVEDSARKYAPRKVRDNPQA